MRKAKKGALGQNTTKSKLFYALLVLIPSLQFLIFYVFVNFNSFLLAFKDFGEGATSVKDFQWDFKTFSNFTYWFGASNKVLSYNHQNLLPAIGVTLKSYAISLTLNVPLGLFFSYYMFKNMPGSKLFRVLLFMPSILSAAPLSIMFRQITENVVGGTDGWLDYNFWSLENRYASMMFFCIFVGFGTSVLMYTNKMNSIAPEIIESAHLDGANGIKEFWYIVLPQTFSIIQVFLITGFAGAFTQQYNAFTLFSWEPGPDVTSLGFLLWNGVRRTEGVVTNMGPYAALGLMISAVIVPLTFLLRWSLNKIGWSEE